MRSEGETEPSSIRGFKEKEQSPAWSHGAELRTRWTWEMKPPASMTSLSELGQAAPVGPLGRPLTHLDALEQNLLPCTAAAWLNSG